MSDLPKHIAVIMDGNGRWANARGLGRVEGHNAGVKALERLVEAVTDFGIEYLTVFAFSSENWGRPKTEVNALMKLLRRYLEDCKEKVLNHESNIRYKFIGNTSKLSEDIVRDIDYIQQISANNQGICLCIAISYGGREEIVAATNKILSDVKAGIIDAGDVSEEMFAKYLYAPEIPYPDLLIRTSGEKRISNFMLWQLAYTEMVFLDVLWPDFNKNSLQDALHEYAKRKRRFGKV